MPPRITVETLLTRIEELERQVRDLQNASRLEDASIQDGALKIYDDQDQLVAQVGKLDDDSHGTDLFDASTGDRIIRLSNQGLMTVSDAENGNLRVEVGLLSTGVTGLRIRGGQGGSDAVSVFEVSNEEGLYRPRQMLPLEGDAHNYEVTNTSYGVEKLNTVFHVSAQKLSVIPIVEVPSGETVTFKLTMENRRSGHPNFGTEVTVHEESYTTGGQKFEFQRLLMPNGVDDVGLFHKFRWYAKTTGGTARFRFSEGGLANHA